MADSDDSTTLPSVSPSDSAFNVDALADRKSINRRNLMAVTTNLLALRTAELLEQRADHPSGPATPAELWRKWSLVHRRRERATRLQQKLEGQVCAAADGFPVVSVPLPGKDRLVVVNSFAEIERLKPQLNAAQLTEVRSELRRRRYKWNEADKTLGYSAALATESELSAEEGMLARILWIAIPRASAEVIAKLHCLIAMEDPGMRHIEEPWPQLRTILGDLVHIERQRIS